MRLGWHVHLLGPFSLGGTIWQSRRRRRVVVYHGTYRGRRCPHNHRRADTAETCARSMARKYGG